MYDDYYSVMGLVAMAIHIIINFNNLGSVKTNKNRDAKAYRKFLYASFFYYLVDSLWGLFYHFQMRRTLYVVSMFYYLTMALSILTWCHFVNIYLKQTGAFGKGLKKFSNTFFVCEVLFLFLNDFDHLFFSIDEAGYHPGPVRYFVFGIQILIFMFVSFQTLIVSAKTKGPSRSRYIAICIFSFSMVICVILQDFYLLIPMYSIGLILGNCVLHVFVVENEKSEYRKQLQNNNEVFSSAGYALWRLVFDEKGKPVKLKGSAKLKEILGVKDESMSPSQLFNYYIGRLSDKSKQLAFEDFALMREGQVKSRVVEWNHPTKGLIYLSVGGTQNYNYDQSMTLSGYMGDTTEHVQELESLNNSLEQANKAKSMFLFNMSHDIRTPMNAIIGFTNLLEKNYDDKEKSLGYIEKIRTSSDFLLSLINNVLEMARIENGKASLDESVNHVDVFINSINSIFEEQMREKGIAFTTTIDVQHNVILCDAVKLREIYLNLLSNAFKYTLPGGKVNFEVREIPNSWEAYAKYKVTISDTGVGMSKEFLPKLFNEFSRESTYTDNRIEGTGLGMSIVKKYLDLMEGHIQVESELGKGTTFTIVIYHKIAEDSHVNKAENTDEGLVSFEGKRILLAEDNDLNAEIAIEILSEFGFEVERANDGVICVDMISNSESGYYDLVLMDIQMPNMNGYEAANRIRKMQNPKKAFIPIVAMTANAFARDRKMAAEVGMNGHIAKPIDVDAMIQLLSQILGKKESI